MTTPQQPPDPRPVVVQDNDSEALALELAAAAAAAGGIYEALKAVSSWAHVQWIRRFRKPRVRQSGPDFLDYTRELAARIRGVDIPRDVQDTLIDYAHKARTLGVAQGFMEAGARPKDVPTAIDWNSHQRAADAVETARQKLDKAANLVDGLQAGSLATVNRSIAPAQQAANIVRRTARTITNDELNRGIASVADSLGARLLWVAERDGCRHCAALSGRFANKDGEFDWHLTFGKKAYEPPEIPFTGPPRHENCRCRVTPYIGHDTEAALAVTHDWEDARKEALAKGDHVAAEAAVKAAAAARESASYDMPQALRREAERSILMGTALPSESVNARADAAERLLARIGTAKNAPAPSGWKVPASVKKRTQRALADGTFTTGPVPTRR